MKEITAIGRWFLAAIAATAAFFGVTFFSVFVLLFGPFPKDLAEPTAAFLMGSVVVLVGAVMAPRYRLTSAIVLFVLNTAICTSIQTIQIPFLVTGGLLSVVFIAWWFHPRRTKHSTLWVSICAGTVGIVYMSLVLARFVDWPANSTALPSSLTQALGTNAAGVTEFYSYDFGGFIDHQWLWCLDAKPDVVAALVSTLARIFHSSV